MTELITRDINWQHMPGDYRLVYDAIEAEHSAKGRRRLWVLGVDYGVTTGLSLLSVPRDSVFGNAPGEVLSHNSWDVSGTMRMQVRHVTATALRVSQYRTPCLIVCEDFDLGGNRLSGQASGAVVCASLRGGAALQHAVECGHADNAVLVFQGRTIAMTTATNDRLKAWGLYDEGSEHKRDATRHAITMIRRIAQGSVKAADIWEE